MPTARFDLPSRVLVTGAAGGIGAALVRQLADAGVEVLATDLGAPPEGLAVARWIRADLATPDGRSTLVGAVQDTARNDAPLGAFVHVAGMLDPSDWEHIDEIQVERLFALNVQAPFFLARALLPSFAPAASVLLMGSIAGLRASPKTPFYAASKAALRNLGASLALALQPRGVRVNVVAPGLIATPLTDELNRRLADERGVPVTQVEAERAQPIPAGRAGSADEVVATCLFLLSAQASYCTGSTLYPTGGVMAGAI